MVNYRWSTDRYKPVASNHVYSFCHDGKETLIVKYYNMAEYAYWPVNYAKYLELKDAPSHGCYIFDHFKNNPKVNYKRLDESVTFEHVTISNDRGTATHIKQPKEDISSILRENKQLDKLDKDEQILNKALAKGQISQSEYNRLMNYIQGEKEKALASLEKKGYFEGGDQVVVSNAINWEALFNGVIGLFKVAGWMVKGVLQLVGLFFGLMLLLMS